MVYICGENGDGMGMVVDVKDTEVREAISAGDVRASDELK
jgi:hypothetical protein